MARTCATTMDILRLCGISRLMNFGGSRARFVRMHVACVILCPFHVVSNDHVCMRGQHQRIADPSTAPARSLAVLWGTKAFCEPSPH